MIGNPFVPVGRLDVEPAPAAPHTTTGQRETALRQTLRGVDLGTWDDRLIGWAVRFLDEPTLRTVASWIARARQAERRQVLAELAAATGEAGEGR